MKPKNYFITALIAVPIAWMAGYFVLPRYIQNDKVDFEVSIDEVNPETLTTTYYIKTYHWKHGNVIRYKFYYDVLESQIDSIKDLEIKISDKFKSLP